MNEIHVGIVHIWYPCEKWFCKKNEEKILGSVLDKNRIESKCQVAIDEKLDEINAVLQHSPQKSPWGPCMEDCDDRFDVYS
jgi:hypothetical protein